MRSGSPAAGFHGCLRPCRRARRPARSSARRRAEGCCVKTDLLALHIAASEAHRRKRIVAVRFRPIGYGHAGDEQHGHDREDGPALALGGVALPHARIQGLKRSFGILARLNKAIDFEAIDGRPVDLVFLLLLPANPVGEQVKALVSSLSCPSRPTSAPRSTRRSAMRTSSSIYRSCGSISRWRPPTCPRSGKGRRLPLPSARAAGDG
jgi:hypothetical protein